MGEAPRDPEPPADLLLYPESDGEPFRETPEHVEALLFTYQALKWLFRDRSDRYVGGDMMFYCEQGVPSSVVSPDVYVVPGIAPKRRRVYKLWVEKVPPHLVIEMTSKSTRLDDLGRKKAIYEMLGVSEYVLFDPLAEYLSPRMQAYRLVDGAYIRVALGEEAEYPIPALDLALVPQGVSLRVRDLATGALVPELEEATRAAAAANAQAQASDAQAQAANARAAAATAQIQAAEERTRAALRRVQELEALVAGRARRPGPGRRR